MISGPLDHPVFAGLLIILGDPERGTS
jgi:hypothetical protein